MEDTTQYVLVSRIGITLSRCLVSTRSIAPIFWCLIISLSLCVRITSLYSTDSVIKQTLSVYVSTSGCVDTFIDDDDDDNNGEDNNDNNIDHFDDYVISAPFPSLPRSLSLYPLLFFSFSYIRLFFMHVCMCFPFWSANVRKCYSNENNNSNKNNVYVMINKTTFI